MTESDDLHDFEHNQSTDEGFFAKFGIVAAWIIGISVVVVGSLGILIALALPAIQQSREAARRAQAKENLRQLGIAIQNYSSTTASPTDASEQPDSM